jgi:multicomponent Na+:H+ antiporter subunit D
MDGQPHPWALWMIVVPLLGAAAAFVGGGRAAQPIGLLASLATLGCAGGLAAELLARGPWRHAIGGWEAPLGVALVADGLSVVMLVMTAVVGALTGLYAARYFEPRAPRGPSDAPPHRRRYFWSLWLFLWAALDALYLSADLFNLYVTLELLGLAAVPLVALAGGPSLAAAMRYLFVSMLGSLAWLFGVALLYSAHGVLDLHLLSQLLEPSSSVAVALALMTGGMLLKTALFPLHFWLPPAHANAPAPVSALLSGLVVKATFYLVLRLWVQLVPRALADGAAPLLGYLGAAAILWGSVGALRQRRIKLMLAYSTVSQLGYCFLVFALATPDTLRGAVFFVLGHAFAKAALFLAAGNILLALGHDHIDRLRGVGGRLPVTMFAFGLAGVNLLGLPPTGGFIAKWTLLVAALQARAWGLVLVISLGGLLAAAYLVKVLKPALMGAKQAPERPVPAVMQWTALALAVLGVLVGAMPWAPLAVLDAADPFTPRGASP